MLFTPVNAVLLTAAIFSLYGAAYVLYQRYIHPLAKYPGPFLASITDLWQVREFLSLQQPYRLTELHKRYGPVVRYGPDKLSVTFEDAVPAIYQAASRTLPKTEFYDAFGGAHPNVFGTRDEAHHSIRRRHMSHAFSMASIKDMEPYLDENIAILVSKIRQACQTGQAFDLKEWLHNYVIDVLGELAFSQSFGLQMSGDHSRAPPVKEHTLLGSVLGSWPSMIHRSKSILPRLPIESVQELFEGRRKCAELASRCVQRRLEDVKLEESPGNIYAKPRKDLLTTLIRAKDPETGARLTQTDLETEAFGFIIAGTHTTMATTALLFWNLLHNPSCLAQCVDEVSNNLAPLPSDDAVYPITNLESSLPYLRNCMKENFRITPVFSMPLARRVTSPDGLIIAGHHFPQGTSLAICNHALHHSPAIFGPDHNTFLPNRWATDEPATPTATSSSAATKSRLLMHFGLGGRQCIGKTMATTNVLKVVTTLLARFDFELAHEAEQDAAARGDWVGRLPPLISVGVSDLDGGLWVRARERSGDVRMEGQMEGQRMGG